MYEKHITRQHIPRWKYHVFAEESFHETIGKFSTYGIETLDHKALIHDVSVNKVVVAGMAELFNRYQLSPVHLQEAVEDLLP